ncbi:MAG: hypothetical protein D6785_00845, partial [Planctomycetota bacterium]
EKNEKEVKKMEKQLESVQSDQRAHHDKMTSLRVELAGARRHIQSLEDTIERLQEELEEREMRESSSEEAEEFFQERRKKLEANIQRCQEELEEGQKRLYFLEENMQALEEERSEILEREEELKEKGESSYLRFQKITEEISSLKVQRSKIEVRIEDLIERVQENLDVDLRQVFHKIDLEGVVLSEVDEKVQSLSAKLRRLGNVNFEALEELKVVEERYNELKAQEDDLVQSKNSLTEIVEKLDNTCRQRFEHTFHSIRQHFQTLFRKLFGGGKADLVLEENKDLLEAGIDIIAKPPGKEPRSITLLSGGEKTMTTVALSFAIFQYKPSPFCVLYEVDAALDENNIARFLNMLDDFVDNCQFIIISHSRLTISAAEVLYGVTMQEAGVSQAISLELKDIKDKIGIPS